MIAFIVAFSLVGYRVTRFIIEDTLIEGTRLKVILWLRSKDSMWAGKVGDLIECPYCVSVWVCAAAVGLVVASGLTSVPLPGLVWLASAGGTMIVWMIVEGIRQLIEILEEHRDDGG